VSTGRLFFIWRLGDQKDDDERTLHYTRPCSLPTPLLFQAPRNLPSRMLHLLSLIRDTNRAEWSRKEISRRPARPTDKGRIVHLAS